MKVPSPERWQEIERVLDAALEIPPHGRAGFLDEVCAGDTELRAAVAELLQACEESEHFLGEPAFEFAPHLSE